MILSERGGSLKLVQQQRRNKVVQKKKEQQKKQNPTEIQKKLHSRRQIHGETMWSCLSVIKCNIDLGAGRVNADCQIGAVASGGDQLGRTAPRGGNGRSSRFPLDLSPAWRVLFSPARLFQRLTGLLVLSRVYREGGGGGGGGGPTHLNGVAWSGTLGGGTASCAFRPTGDCRARSRGGFSPLAVSSPDQSAVQPACAFELRLAFG